MEHRIVEGAERMKTEDVIRLLRMTYWAGSRPAEKIEASLRNSDCFGIYAGDSERLAGFARVISDHATTWYLCDVVIDPEYRHQDLGKKLVSHIASLPEYTGLLGMLLTKDAHGLYEKYGFGRADGRAMTRVPAPQRND